MIYRPLGHTGMHVSILGFGAATLGNIYGEIDVRESEAAVCAAIDGGINFFDVSPYYGKTLAEERLGAALAGRRDKVVLATKCGRYGLDDFDFSAKRIHQSIDESLQRLRTDYIDLFQAHDVEFTHADQIINETVPALRDIQKNGKARAIGITGYSIRNLRQIAEAVPVDTVLSYCRYNLLVRDMDAVLPPAAQALGFGLINASPLHMSILTERGAPPWHPAPQKIKDAGKAIVDLCRAHGTSAAEVGLRFCVDNTHVASTFAGMARVEEVKQNIALLERRNDPELLAKIEAIIEPVRNTVWPSGLVENYG